MQMCTSVLLAFGGYLGRYHGILLVHYQVSASGDLSNPTGLTVTINREAMARSDIEALGHQEATDTDNTSLTSVPSSQVTGG